MSPQTPKFQTLIERIENSLADLKSSDVARKEALLADRAALVRLSSPQTQIEYYGAENWQNEFVRLRDVPELPFEHPMSRKLRGERLRSHILRELGNVPFLRFQRAFSAVEQVVLPQFEVLERGEIQFSCPDCHELSVRGCIVNPERISGKLAHALGLIDLSQYKRDPKGRLLHLANPEVLDRLKEIFDHARSLSRPDKSYRVLLLPAREFEKQPKLAGAVVVTREKSQRFERGTPRGLSPLVVSFFPDVYSAKRGIVHSERGYDREVRALSEMEESIRSLKVRVKRDWRAQALPEVKEVLKEEVQEILAGYQLLLKRARNLFKEEASYFLQEAHTLKDSTGRLNPTKTVLQMEASVRRLKQRVHEIQQKDSHTQKDRHILESHISRSEQAFRGARHRLGREGTFRAAIIDDSGAKLFSRERLSSRELDRQAKGLLVRLGIHRDDFSLIESQPFFNSATAIRSQVQLLERALQERDRESAKRALNGIQIILKLNAVVVGLEHLKEAAAQGTDVPFLRLRELSTTLSNVLGEEPYFAIASSPIRADAEQVISQIQKDVRAMTRALAHYSKSTISNKEREAMNERFRDFLDSFSRYGVKRTIEQVGQEA